MEVLNPVQPDVGYVETVLQNREQADAMHAYKAAIINRISPVGQLLGSVPVATPMDVAQEEALAMNSAIKQRIAIERRTIDIRGDHCADRQFSYGEALQHLTQNSSDFQAKFSNRLQSPKEVKAEVKYQSRAQKYSQRIAKAIDENKFNKMGKLITTARARFKFDSPGSFDYFNERLKQVVAGAIEKKVDGQHPDTVVELYQHLNRAVAFTIQCEDFEPATIQKLRASDPVRSGVKEMMMKLGVKNDDLVELRRIRGLWVSSGILGGKDVELDTTVKQHYLDEAKSMAWWSFREFQAAINELRRIKMITEDDAQIKNFMPLADVILRAAADSSGHHGYTKRRNEFLQFAVVP